MHGLKRGKKRKQGKCFAATTRKFWVESAGPRQKAGNRETFLEEKKGVGELKIGNFTLMKRSLRMGEKLCDKENQSKLGQPLSGTDYNNLLEKIKKGVPKRIAQVVGI